MSKIETYEGDMFWDAADTEDSIDSPEEHLENVGCGQVVKFEQAKRLPDFYGIQYYDADKDEYLCEFFTTAEEAEAFNLEKVPAQAE